MTEAIDWALGIHGGAGPLAPGEYVAETAFLSETLRRGAADLAAGAEAIAVVRAAVRALEDCGHHIAGRGAGPNRDGVFELDAAIMDGARRRAGAVAGLVGFRSPIEAAACVMNETPHVLVIGDGAAALAAAHGLERIVDSAAYYRPVVVKPLNDSPLAHGTVGAVARDRAGRLAAATSTGGLINKLPGRVGDAPLIGAGTWADERVALSCTGQGEYFIRAAAAADVSARIAYLGAPLREAMEGALADMARLGGDGGMIAVDAMGRIDAIYTSQSMKRGLADASGRFEVKIFA